MRGPAGCTFVKHECTPCRLFEDCHAKDKAQKQVEAEAAERSEKKKKADK